MSIFTHVTVGTNDLQKARDFYDKVLGALGQKRLADLDDNGSIWEQERPVLLRAETGQRRPGERGQRCHGQL